MDSPVHWKWIRHPLALWWWVVQVATFVMMYRTHCQRILDTVIRASFDEVRLGKC